MASSSRALRASAGGEIDTAAVVATARDLGVMGWVRPTGELHAEDAEAGTMQAVADEAHLGGRAGQAVDQQNARAATAQMEFGRLDHGCRLARLRACSSCPGFRMDAASFARVSRVGATLA